MPATVPVGFASLVKLSMNILKAADRPFPSLEEGTLIVPHAMGVLSRPDDCRHGSCTESYKLCFLDSGACTGFRFAYGLGVD